MARHESTFGGTHRPVRRDGRAHTMREAQDHASFDNAPATSGCGTFLLTTVALAIALLIGALG